MIEVAIYNRIFTKNGKPYVFEFLEPLYLYWKDDYLICDSYFIKAKCSEDEYKNPESVNKIMLKAMMDNYKNNLIPVYCQVFDDEASWKKFMGIKDSNNE